MKTNLIEKVKRMSTEYRFGDFFRNFIAVVLGIVITFAGSDLIEERKIRNEVKDALSLVKDEILLNRETIEELMEQELFEQRGACYLLQYKDSIDKASPDQLRNMAIRHSSHSILFILMMQWRCSKVHRLSLLLKIKTCYPDYSNIQHDKNRLWQFWGFYGYKAEMY